jgi:hypothetical protein
LRSGCTAFNAGNKLAVRTLDRLDGFDNHCITASAPQCSLPTGSVAAERHGRLFRQQPAVSCDETTGRNIRGPDRVCKNCKPVRRLSIARLRGTVLDEGMSILNPWCLALAAVVAGNAFTLQSE